MGIPTALGRFVVLNRLTSFHHLVLRQTVVSSTPSISRCYSYNALEGRSTSGRTSYLKQRNNIPFMSQTKTISTYSWSARWLPLLNHKHESVLVLPCRHYAKGKGKGKSSKGGKVMKLSEEELNSVIDSEKFQHQLQSQIEHLKTEFIQQLALRTSLGAFDNLQIETQDGKFPLMQLAQVAQKGHNTVVINLVSSPQYIPVVKESLVNSMSLNPQQDGTTLYVSIPKVTKEHRESLVKTAKGMCDKTKTKLRDTQNKFLHDMKKAKDDHSEDIIFSVQRFIQNKTKEFIDLSNQITAAKQKELLGGK